MTGDNVTCGLVKIQTTDNQPVALFQSFNACAMLVSSFLFLIGRRPTCPTAYTCKKGACGKWMSERQRGFWGRAS